MSDETNAVERLFKAKGDGYCFPGDEIWAYLKNEAPHYLDKPGIIRKLVSSGYLVATGRTTKATTGPRKGSPARQYTFGPTISATSLGIATAAPIVALVASENSVDRDPLDQLENKSGKYPLEWPLQRIVHGCPGSGKSHLVEKQAAEAHYVIRTVFHPESSYSDFVGGLRPQSIYKILETPPVFTGSTMDVPGEPYVQYVIQTGPLLKAYYLACLHPQKSVVLVVEELSRAVAAHVFGDCLQLLDRIEEGELTGYSAYQIEPRPDIASWLILNEVWHDFVSIGGMRFPPNLYIWATMNRADQNARQLDAAFLRRWNKQYMSYLTAGAYDDAAVRYGGAEVSWGALRTAANVKLKSLEGVPEDKFIGPYMLSRRQLSNPHAVFEDLWGYVWNDVLRTRSTTFFLSAKTFAELEEVWNNGQGAPIGPLNPGS